MFCVERSNHDTRTTVHDTYFKHVIWSYNPPIVVTYHTSLPYSWRHTLWPHGLTSQLRWRPNMDATQHSPLFLWNLGKWHPHCKSIPLRFLQANARFLPIRRAKLINIYYILTWIKERKYLKKYMSIYLRDIFPQSFFLYVIKTIQDWLLMLPWQKKIISLPFFEFCYHTRHGIPIYDTIYL